MIVLNIILNAILWIAVISVLAGIVATIKEVVEEFKGLKRFKGLSSNHKPYGPYERFVKRGLDACLATGALIVFSPVLLITAILVRIKLGSPVLFCQERPGLNERIFKIYKFRSMTDEKDKNGELLPDEVRLTKFGKLLRSTSLDELPELFNILCGDMAVVGPRPLLIQYLPYYSPQQKLRHTIRPGLTGLAQTHGRNAINWDEKLAWDVKYVEKITFLDDWKIIWNTAMKVLKREGINSATSATMDSFVDYCKGKQ